MSCQVKNAYSQLRWTARGGVMGRTSSRRRDWHHRGWSPPGMSNGPAPGCELTFVRLLPFVIPVMLRRKRISPGSRRKFGTSAA
jgi:hypothetical protein